MSQSEGECEETIANLRGEKEELENQLKALQERNSNQAMLLKRLETARQDDRKYFEAEIAELKLALSEERIKTRKAFSHHNPLSPAASQRSLLSASPMTSTPALTQGDVANRRVFQDERKFWKDSTGDITDANTDRSGNTAQVQSALVDAAMKKKLRKEKSGGFWSLFGPTQKEEPENEVTKRNAALVKKTEGDRKSVLTREIIHALEENKRVIEEREQELTAREEVQRVKEDAMRKSLQQQTAMNSSLGFLSFSGKKDDEDDVPAPKTQDQVNMNNISKLRDSEMLDVDTLRRLIADRTEGMNEEDVTKTTMNLDDEEAIEGSESEYGPEYDDEDQVLAAEARV